MTNTQNASCLVCSKPLAGRGKCKSYAHVAIGPRAVGTVWTERFAHPSSAVRVEVVRVLTEADGIPSWWGGWGIVERDLNGSDAGRLRTHCTAWDARRNVVAA
jgi:hypothetical protein